LSYSAIFSLLPVRASAFTFSASKISLTATCFEEKITAKSNKSKEGRKKGPESKNLFDFFDFAVKILPKPGSLSEHKSKHPCPAMGLRALEIPR
jgi:hypothetical protein